MNTVKSILAFSKIFSLLGLKEEGYTGEGCDYSGHNFAGYVTTNNELILGILCEDCLTDLFCDLDINLRTFFTELEKTTCEIGLTLRMLVNIRFERRWESLRSSIPNLNLEFISKEEIVERLTAKKVNTKAEQ